MIDRKEGRKARREERRKTRGHIMCQNAENQFRIVGAFYFFHICIFYTFCSQHAIFYKQEETNIFNWGSSPPCCPRRPQPPSQAGEYMIVLRELHPNPMILANRKKDQNIQNEVQYTDAQASRLQKKKIKQK